MRQLGVAAPRAERAGRRGEPPRRRPGGCASSTSTVFFLGTAIVGSSRWPAAGAEPGDATGDSADVRQRAGSRLVAQLVERRPSGDRATRRGRSRSRPRCGRHRTSGHSPAQSSRHSGASGSSSSTRLADQRLEVELVALEREGLVARRAAARTARARRHVEPAAGRRRGSAGRRPSHGARHPAGDHDAVAQALQDDVDLDRRAGGHRRVDRRSGPSDGDLGCADSLACAGRRRSSATLTTSGRASPATLTQSDPGRRSRRCAALLGIGLGLATGAARRCQLLAPGGHRLRRPLEDDLEAGQPLVAEVLGLEAHAPGLVLGRLDDLAGPHARPPARPRCAAPSARPGPGPRRGCPRPRAGPWRGTPRAPSASSGPGAARRAGG